MKIERQSANLVGLMFGVSFAGVSTPIVVDNNTLSLIEKMGRICHSSSRTAWPSLLTNG